MQSFESPSILTVSQLTASIKKNLESAFSHLWLQGEISNFKAQSSGHFYFSLKDPYAQIAAIMFRSEASNLKIPPKDGAQVIVRGELSVYPQTGRYQLIVREMRYLGIGELLVRLEELKAKLHAKGWFSEEHKKKLPLFPKRIGVVTSPTGAVIQDILRVLQRRYPGFHLILNPVRVQGEGAAQEIARAIQQFNAYCLADVLIVGRGGGSIEDLWAFNEEVVAEAIFNSRIPIISAVGHETDVCLSDFVADARAPTPSAAAAMAVPDKHQVQNHLQQLHQRLCQHLVQLIRYDRQRLMTAQKHPLLATPYGLLGSRIQGLDILKDEIQSTIGRQLKTDRFKLEAIGRQLAALNPATRILYYKKKLSIWRNTLDTTIFSHIVQLKKSLQRQNLHLSLIWNAKQQMRHQKFSSIRMYKQLNQAWNQHLVLRRKNLINIANHLYSIDPKNLLTKGYAILFNEKSNSVITSVKSIEAKQGIQALLHDGKILATVKEIIQP